MCCDVLDALSVTVNVMVTMPLSPSVTLGESIEKTGSSVVVIATFTLDKPSYVLSPLIPGDAGLSTTFQSTLPSLKLSLAPVTVTVCGVLQFMVVKVIVLGDTEPSVESPLETATVTLADGAALSFTVNVDMLPDSVTVLLLVGVLVTSSLGGGLIVKEPMV